jgi:hypothetical protein
MSKSKAVTLSIWIWLIGGVIIGGVVLLGAFYNLGLLGQQTATNQITTDFKELTERKIDLICDRSKGSRQSMRVNLRGVRGIYSSDTISDPPDDVPQRIAQSDRFKGKYVCLKFKNQEPTCYESSCQVKTTYMGEPMPGSDMYRLGEGGGWTFDIKIEKTDSNEVTVEGQHVP